ncbi:MAG TPA: CpsD/CapB family tyrosine-protein kinase [Solirubrobacteraceae bacterium]|jgi:Mrp family chromosome partitioning ATPase
MNDTRSDSASIFAPLWKRKWLILAVAILVAAATYEYYKHRHSNFKATTQLFLGGGSEQSPGAGGGTGKSTLTGRALADQVGLINSPIVGKPAREMLRAEHDLQGARAKATATANAASDFITITTEAAKPKPAIALANAYAQVYIKRQRRDYLAGLQAQIVTARAQLRRIETPPPAGQTGSKSAAPSSTSTLQAANLASKISQLETALTTFSGVQQVGTARAQSLGASASPKKNAIFGFVIGLILASIAAYVLSRFDRRVRGLGDVEALFNTEILAALPAVRSPVVRPDGQRAPAKSLLEPLRRLHTTLRLRDPREAAGGARAPRTILFLSPDAGDGRSTLIANLARVQSDSGERVAVVEADFRRPAQARLLGLDGQYGLADVLTGTVPMEQALQSARSGATVSPAGDGTAPAGSVSTVVESRSIGSLSALVGGGSVANPPALLSGERMAEMLRALAEEFDYVLIDAPPPPEVSDAMPLLQLVDAIVLVARIGHTREVSAQRLAQLLAGTASAPVLGAVVNSVPRRDIESYGFAFAPVQPRRRRLIGR